MPLRLKRVEQSVEIDPALVRSRRGPVIFNTATNTEDDQTEANVERVDSSGWDTGYGSILSIDHETRGFD